MHQTNKTPSTEPQHLHEHYSTRGAKRALHEKRHHHLPKELLAIASRADCSSGLPSVKKSSVCIQSTDKKFVNCSISPHPHLRPMDQRAPTCFVSSWRERISAMKTLCTRCRWSRAAPPSISILAHKSFRRYRRSAGCHVTTQHTHVLVTNAPPAPHSPQHHNEEGEEDGVNATNVRQQKETA